MLRELIDIFEVFCHNSALMKIRALFLLALSVAIFFGASSLPAFASSGVDCMECFEEGKGAVAISHETYDGPIEVESWPVLPDNDKSIDQFVFAIEHPPKYPF
jgi:hypothetical protein